MKVLITNVFGSTNKGDALLLESLVDNLHHVYGKDKIDISGIAQFPEVEKKHFPEIKWFQSPGRSRAKNIIFRRINNLILITRTIIFYAISRMLRLSRIGISDVDGILAMSKADLIVASGGGYLLDINASYYNNLIQIYLATTNNAPVILGPQTFGPISKPINENFLKFVLSRVDVICAREDISKNYVESLGIATNKIVRCEDLAFDFPNIKNRLSFEPIHGDAQLQKFLNRNYITITFVDWYFPDLNRKEMTDRYVNEMQCLIQMILDKTSFSVFVLNQVSSDLNLSRRILSKFQSDRIFLDKSDLSTQEIMSIVSASTALVGSRFHSCVFALLCNTPLISIAYTHKSTGIMMSLNLDNCLFHINTFNAREVWKKLSLILKDSVSYRNQIESATKRLESTKFSVVLKSKTHLNDLQKKEIMQ